MTYDLGRLNCDVHVGADMSVVSVRYEDAISGKVWVDFFISEESCRLLENGVQGGETLRDAIGSLERVARQRVLEKLPEHLQEPFFREWRNYMAVPEVDR